MDWNTNELYRLIYLKDSNLGWGAAANAAIPAGEVVHDFADAPIVDERTWLSVQIDVDRDVDDPFLAKLNHSCDPSLLIDTENRRCIAARDLDEGELLTFFYPSTEWNIVQPFRCHCESDHCLGLIQGARHLSSDILSAFHLSSHIQRLIAKRDRQLQLSS